MTEAALPGDPSVAITLRRSGRARRVSLRVSRLDGRVTLTLPPGMGEARALDFAQQKSGWIRAQLAALSPPAAVGEGTVLPVDGRDRRVASAPGAPRLTEGAVRVRPGRAPGPQVAAVLKEAARARLVAASERHAAALGARIARVTLRDTRSRWGSCSSRGALMYSWRLILAPPAVLDYVAAHEVAHLERMDHSPAFWATVARLAPDHAAPRRWLRDHGAGLHAWRFDGS